MTVDVKHWSHFLKPVICFSAVKAFQMRVRWPLCSDRFVEHYMRQLEGLDNL